MDTLEAQTIESACNAGDLVSIPGLGRSSREGSSYPIQCNGLENAMDCIVHGVAKSRTRLSGFHFSLYLIKQTASSFFLVVDCSAISMPSLRRALSLH